MGRAWKQVGSRFLLASLVTLALSGCNSQAVTSETEAKTTPPEVVPAPQKEAEQPKQKVDDQGESEVKPTPAEEDKKADATPVEKIPVEPQKESKVEEIPTDLALEVVAEPASMVVLVNKQRKLPEEYNPTDLVVPNVPFIFPEKSDKRKMRQEAAGALEQMFAAAKADGIELAGVSGYRSHTYQKELFARYVKKDGLEVARTYSAYPGTSEHETGLAMDISGIDGKCAASSCFAGTKEAEWLAQHATEYGFIVRYPLGKEAITGYIYEHWHLRYVGLELAKEIFASGLTLEEHFGVVPVTRENP
jgi:zinc D-Ala-D-Ala carboxypeptidase